MRVTRLEIFGFKSFVDRFVLDFDKNIIGIIGPNGCGKSNIVDSLRWVLGEKNARQLRGSLLEDLIFNGSDTRRPLGMAEVSITIQPDANWGRNYDSLKDPTVKELDSSVKSIKEIEKSTEEETEEEQEESKNKPAEDEGEGFSLEDIPGLFNAAEIQLTRRLYRSGESEYFINRVPCRLRDMVDLYRLIGLGSRGINIVQQGTVGSIISKKPIERRELLEEAAGISGFRAKIEAAGRRLDKTSENIARINDIVIEVEKQVRVLKRQANKAQSREQLKNDLKDAEFKLFELLSSKLVIKKQDNLVLRNKVREEQENLLGKLEVFNSEQQKFQADLERIDREILEFRAKRSETQSKLETERSREQKVKLDLISTETRISSIKENTLTLKNKADLIKLDIQAKRDELEKAKEGLELVKSKKTEIENLLGTIQANSSDELSEITIEEAISKLKSTVQNAKVEEFDQLIAQLEKQIGGLEGIVSKSQTQSVELIERQNELRNILTDFQQESLKVQGLSSELGYLCKQEQELDLELNSSQKEISELENQLKVAENINQETNFDEIRQFVEKLSYQLISTEEELTKLEDSRAEIQRQLSSKSQEAAEIRIVTDRQKDELNRAEREIERSQIELEHQKSDIEKYYNTLPELLNYNNAKLVVSNFEDNFEEHTDKLQSLATSLRRKLEREGEVDPESVKLYEEEKERLQKMQAQLEDLSSAAKILEETIKKLKEISKEKFVTTFNDVSEKFSVLVPRLFGGGSGQLALVNPEDALTSGVELNVRIPGKKLRSMELLSGGEKAMVATALLIAMFLHRPSPICVMDEVDAPLDDANLDRFLSVVSEISKSTQMLIVTHNKQTMSAVDRLLGITMQEKGVSTALSVSVDEVEADLDKWVANY